MNQHKLFAKLSGSLFLLLLTPVAGAVTAHDAPPGRWSKGSFGISLNTEYFTSKANYDIERGSYKRLPLDSSYSSIEGRLKARFNFTSRFSLFGGAGLMNARAVDPLNEKVTNQISDLFLGADFLLTKKVFHVIPEVQVGYPIDRIDVNRTEPLTNDGYPYIRAGIFAHRPFRKFRLGGYAGFHVPLEGGLAKRFHYEVTGDYLLFQYITLGVGINGYETVMSDDLTLADRVILTTRANAGSQRYYSFDPALIEARMWIGYRANETLWLRLGYGKTLDGMHTAEGQSVLASLAYNSIRPTSAFDRTRRRSSQDRALESFEVDVEKTEKGIFEMEAEEGSLDDAERMLEKKNQEQQDE
jgi:hypothetical protein